MLPNFLSALAWWQWAILAAVPPAIVALYFLKLRRQRVDVPSTYLWHKSIEDLHVNSLWQRLRRNILLLLQLLIVAAACLALARPSWRGTKLAGDRFIFLVDNSASMAARDVEPSRLEEAKRQVAALVDQMKTDDVAMIISFADRCRVEAPFTDNRKELKRRLAAIRPSQRSTSIAEALTVASGLANPGRIATEAGDTQVADPLPAMLFIFSDGKFPDVQGFALGNLDPVFVPIGQTEAANVSILAFSARRHEQRPDQIEAFGRLASFGAEPLTADVELYRDGQLVDAQQVELSPGEDSGVAFKLDAFESGGLELRVDTGDSLAVDDRAWAAVNPPRRARVLFVSPGNEPLSLALATERAAQVAEVTSVGPEYCTSDDYRRAARDGRFDLMIFDRYRPDELPQSSTLFIGALPPAPLWSAESKATMPQILDTDRAHPLLQMISLDDVVIVEGTPLKPPAGAKVLVDTHLGPVMAIAARERYEDLVLGFELMGESGIGTNWPIRLSFPLFVLNAIEYFGARQDGGFAESLRPGQAIDLPADSPTSQLAVRLPDARQLPLARGQFNRFRFNGTDQVGSYEVFDRANKQASRRFSVNLFDAAESDIAPRAKNSVRIGHVEVTGRREVQTARLEAWKPLLLVALAVLLFEWYIYNRRVYL